MYCITCMSQSLLPYLLFHHAWFHAIRHEYRLLMKSLEGVLLSLYSYRGSGDINFMYCIACMNQSLLPQDLKMSNVKTMHGLGFVNLPSLLYHPYLVCILFGMPSLHLFTFLMFLKSCFCTFLVLDLKCDYAQPQNLKWH